MDYNSVEKSLEQGILRLAPLSESQRHRLGQLCMSLLLAGETNLRKLARQLPGDTKQDSRVRWLQRLLTTPFMTAEVVYHPMIKSILHGLKAKEIHLIMDRSDVIDHQVDLLSINLSFRKRSIPIAWQLRATGMTSANTQIQLLKVCEPLLPPESTVIFHGDNEFGSVAMMRWLTAHHWHFILGQASKNYARRIGDGQPFQLDTLPITQTQSARLNHLELTKAHWWGPVNLFGFYNPVYHRNRRKQDVRYYATSLPSHRNWRRIGARRWGIECYFKDLKSSGWNLTYARIDTQKRLSGLILGLNIVYLWATCVGRWLCKTSRRSEVDNYPIRHLSLFRMGWDWLVNALRSGASCPDLTRLYS